MSESTAFVPNLISFLIHIGIAIVVVLIGLALARWGRRLMRKAVTNPRLSESLGPSVRDLIVRITYYAIIVLAFALALIALGVPSTYVIAALAIIFIILGVALQQSLVNLTATIIFLTYQPFHRGELIETMGYTGTVQEIQLFNTVLVTTDQRYVSLANGMVQEAGVVNYTRAGINRADVELTVGYSTDFGQVRTLLLEMVQQDRRVLQDPAPDVIVLELRDTGVQLALRAFARSDDYWQVLFDLRERATARLAAAGIEFARNQTNVTVATTVDSLAPTAST